jgi:predicted acyl esterase
MLGASYNAYCEWMAAKMQPPALKTMISTVPMPGPPDGAPWSGGMFYISGMLSWYGLLHDKAHTTPFNQDMTASLNTLPIPLADSALFGSPIPSFQYWVERDKYDEAVKQGGYREEMAKIDIPVLHLSGWLDSVGVGTRLNYMQFLLWLAFRHRHVFVVYYAQQRSPAIRE